MLNIIIYISNAFVKAQDNQKLHDLKKFQFIIHYFLLNNTVRIYTRNTY